MPGGGTALASRDRPGAGRAARIMCVSARDDAETALAMLAAGATAYVAKGALDEDLASCVRRCGEGRLFVIAACAREVRQRSWRSGAGRARPADPSGTDALRGERFERTSSRAPGLLARWRGR